jgi:hypothetical protein
MTWEQERIQFLAAQQARNRGIISPEQYALLRSHFYRMCQQHRVRFWDSTYDWTKTGVPSHFVSLL